MQVQKKSFSLSPCGAPGPLDRKRAPQFTQLLIYAASMKANISRALFDEA